MSLEVAPRRLLLEGTVSHVTHVVFVIDLMPFRMPCTSLAWKFIAERGLLCRDLVGII